MMQKIASCSNSSLATAINLSLVTGIYVDDWKRARVTLIYKSEDKKKCENYRPISILPIISKRGVSSIVPLPL
jgi:hypothetical protein